VRAQEEMICTVRSRAKNPSAIGSARSCTRFKLREQEGESPDERRGHRDFGIREIKSSEDRRSRISMVKVPRTI
jgi:hypothetical protein